MWNRVEFKLLAKSRLKGHWGLAALCQLILSVLSVCASLVVMLLSMMFLIPIIINTSFGAGSSANSFTSFDLDSLKGPYSMMIFVLSLIIFIVAVLISAYIEKKNFQISKALYNDEPFTTGICFKENSLILKLIGLNLLRSLYVFLWSLLFVVPGIYKVFKYSYSSLILLSDPSVSVQQSLKESCNITKGQVLNLIVLQLSFVGWLFLSAFTFGIGSLFLQPYINLSFYASFIELNKHKTENTIA